MLEEYKVAYQELSQASSAEFADMVSKTEYKKAIRRLMGNNTAVAELGLSDQTIRKLERSNIRSMDILVDYYDKGWLESQSYLKEIANKLEDYVRDMLSMLVSENEMIPLEEPAAYTEADTEHRAENTIQELRPALKNPIRRIRLFNMNTYRKQLRIIRIMMNRLMY